MGWGLGVHTYSWYVFVIYWVQGRGTEDNPTLPMCRIPSPKSCPDCPFWSDFSPNISHTHVGVTYILQIPHCRAFGHMENSCGSSKLPSMEHPNSKKQMMEDRKRVWRLWTSAEQWAGPWIQVMSDFLLHQRQPQPCSLRRNRADRPWMWLSWAWGQWVTHRRLSADVWGQSTWQEAALDSSAVWVFFFCKTQRSFISAERSDGLQMQPHTQKTPSGMLAVWRRNIFLQGKVTRLFFSSATPLQNHFQRGFQSIHDLK